MGDVIRKGERAEFDSPRGTVTGTVTRGGTRPEITEDGTARIFTVAAALLRRTDVPAPEHAQHPMDAWSVSGFRHYAQEPDGRFDAVVDLDGNPALVVRGRSNGATCSYTSVTGGYATAARFEDDAAAWLADAGMPEGLLADAADAWLAWKVFRAPYGVSARAFVEEIAGPLPEGRSAMQAGA